MNKTKQQTEMDSKTENLNKHRKLESIGIWAIIELKVSAMLCLIEVNINTIRSLNRQPFGDSNCHIEYHTLHLQWCTLIHFYVHHHYED